MIQEEEITEKMEDLEGRTWLSRALRSEWAHYLSSLSYLLCSCRWGREHTFGEEEKEEEEDYCSRYCQSPIRRAGFCLLPLLIYSNSLAFTVQDGLVAEATEAAEGEATLDLGLAKKKKKKKKVSRIESMYTQISIEKISLLLNRYVVEIQLWYTSNHRIVARD